MPLLYGLTPFKRLPDPEVSPETNLFYIQETEEGFVKFSDFIERLTIVHSNIWACAVTKRNGLTLEDAFLSEQNAHKNFPDYGKRIILFIGFKYFQNASFTELVYGVYKIIRERYFLNEWVRFHIEAKATFARVIEVTHSPSQESVSDQSDYGVFPSNCYRYVIEFYDHVKGRNITLCVTHDQLSRLPTYSSRNSLHKYFAEIVDKNEKSGHVIFKMDEIERLDVDKLSWNDIFAVPEPFHGGLKRKGRPVNLDESELNGEQFSSGLQSKRAKTETDALSEWDKYRQTEKEVKKERERMAENRLLLWEDMKWSEDLDLNDLKVLPQFEKLNLQMPINQFGDVLNLYGFICAFKSMLEGFDSSFMLQDLIHAIYANENQNKPLLMLMSCLVRTRNGRVANEDYDEANIKNERDIPDEFRNELSGQFGEEIKSRNLLLERIRCCHGASLNNIQVNENSLNQHVLYALHTAGNCPRQVAMDVRKETRGDIQCAEDELFLFSINNVDILKAIEKKSICELAPSHRLKLLQAFAKNLLTYGEFRKCFQDDLLELKRLTQRMLRLSYLERQYESDFSDTITLMDEMFPEFTLKRNGHSKKVDDAIIKYLRMPTVSDAINLTQMKTRFDYVEKGKRDELRKVQHNVIELRSRQITQEMNSIYKRLGCVLLGIDRAFRQYIYVEELSLIFIEGPLDRTLEAHCQDTNEEDEKFIACTSNSTCPIHSCYSDYQWAIPADDESLNKLMLTLDPRGLREGPLLANLKACMENVRRSLDSMADISSTINEMFKIPDVYISLEDEDYYKKLFCGKVLDFEQKLNDRFLLDEQFSAKRKEWRNSLSKNFDTKQFCPKRGLLFDSGDILIFEKSELDSLNFAQTLGISLFQIANSLILDCLKEPFVDHHRGAVPIATTTFGSWAQGVCNVSSLNELWFYLTSIENAIKWSFKVPKTISCTLCGSRGSKTTMIKCATCTRPYHKTCVTLDPYSENWSCTTCVPPPTTHSSRRRKPSPGHFLRLSTVGNISLE